MHDNFLKNDNNNYNAYYQQGKYYNIGQYQNTNIPLIKKQQEKMNEYSKNIV